MVKVTCFYALFVFPTNDNAHGMVWDASLSPWILLQKKNILVVGKRQTKIKMESANDSEVKA